MLRSVHIPLNIHRDGPAPQGFCYTTRVMAQPPRGRKRVLVNRAYQIPFASRMVLITFVVAAVSYLIAMAILWRHLYQSELQARYYVVAGLTGAAITLLVELIVMIPVLYYFGLRQSHRVVGPMRRMVHAIDALGEGDYSRRLNLRTGDVLEELARAINRLAETLGKRRGSR